MSEDSARVTREVVLPLAVVMALLVNALLVGIAWGRYGQRLDIIDSNQAALSASLRENLNADQALRDRVRDLERDAKEDRKDFDLLQDYTRGRIDRLPYRAPLSRQ